jgi:uncharacterized protein YdeI (YjbR/CyaY-like superfamily)/molybdopterin converting factor small subunit
MAQVHIPRSLVALFPGVPRYLEVEASSIEALIRVLDARHPGMWDRLCEPGPRIREHINVFVDGQRVGIDARLVPGSVVHIIPAVSGGGQGETEGGQGDSESVHAETREAWREWLAANHGRTSGVWLVSWKPSTGRPRLTYDEAIEEALCFGWVDSRSRSLDAERSALWMSPRRSGGLWSRSNKERVERLEREDRMTAVGRRVVEAARADGSWSRLDAVDELVVPDDLSAAFAARPGARAHWDAFPSSVKRDILTWIVTARRAETRARRVSETAELAQRGERAHQPGQRGERPHQRSVT